MYDKGTKMMDMAEIAGKQILLVDDSPSSRKFICQVLSHTGITILEAENGLDALDILAKTRVDLVITDIFMPKLNGVELCKKLKENPDLAEIPVIVVSNFNSETDIQLGFEAGASDYLSKMEVGAFLPEKVCTLLKRKCFAAKQKVLIVDNSPSTLEILAKALSDAGFHTMCSGSGARAMEKLEKSAPDLVLLNINMPALNVLQFHKELRKRLQKKSVPLIVMSTEEERWKIKQLKDLGAAAYLIKPFNTDSMVLLVENLLSNQYINLLKEKKRLEKEQANLLASIMSLTKALEARDLYTKGHSENVARIAEQMAKAGGLAEEEIAILRQGALLHDIGKIGVPDAILLKPDRLSEEEFLVIKRHPLTGYEILRPISELDRVREIVRHHHERFDGKGYPDGLKSTQIPLLARIAAVADTFDALTHERPYKKAETTAAALSIINQVRGTQLCPKCVDMLMAVHSRELIYA